MFSSKSISATQKRLLALSVKNISDNEVYNSDGQKSWNSDTNVINYIKKWQYVHNYRSTLSEFFEKGYISAISEEVNW